MDGKTNNFSYRKDISMMQLEPGAPVGTVEKMKEELGTQVLELKGPQWTSSGNRYESDQMARTIVDFLVELQQVSVDRAEHPDIARFSTRDIGDRFAIQDNFNHELANSILKEVARRDMNIAVMMFRPRGGGGLIAYRDSRFGPKGNRYRFSRFLHGLGINDPYEPKEVTSPKRILELTFDQKNLCHTVRIVHLGDRPIKYAYFDYWRG
ncbi:MAG: hypothetical protein U9Q67_04125 [Patescibacteria group bacterium]|nr:hypothetical protein [Patescibacteria group bacterium]